MRLANFITIRLLDNTLTDRQLVESLLELQATPVKRIVMLPWQISRGARLLAGSDIQIGGAVDYPLGQGTAGKVSFEVADCFQNGADFVEVSLSPKELLLVPASMNAYMRELERLAANWGAILFHVDTQQYLIDEKIMFAEFVRGHSDYAFSLANGLDNEQANVDADIWKLSSDSSLQLQVNLLAPTTGQVKMMLHNGVRQVGIYSWENVDLLETITFA